MIQFLSDLSSVGEVYLACGRTDMRKSIDGLAAIIEQQFRMDPFTRTLFLFCGRRADRIKGLLWEGDGFLLIYKRLESGRFQWPRDSCGRYCKNAWHGPESRPSCPSPRAWRESARWPYR